jgi:DNA-binding transcriptional MerR regulator
VSSRSYLSIGDVLTLLREEFPDVTISKIRFLESQGLVNPERSPSGYRKFFDHDVERLRWVLRQQREHFLPLKVIRDRLTDGELEDGDLEEGDNGKQRGTGVLAGVEATDGGEQPTKADEAAMARILADASRRTARMPEAASARQGQSKFGEAPTSVSEMSGPGASPAPAGHAAAAGGVRPNSRGMAASASPAPTPSPPTKGSGRVNGVTQPGPSEPSPSSTASPKGDATGTPATSATPPAPRGGQRPEDAAAGTPRVGMVTGASMTADELCAASGLSREELEGLEGFGLIGSVRVAGMATYDEEALVVANLAAAFRGFGIEARHLRLYRNAADRELGLIEQVVIPLLRQRNPESRQRAVESADQLAALGQSMRASLLRQALRQHFGG